ncbi:MAG: helix-turn-helix transcriptional regulator [Firmicutes bacterium]|nr:helix-turn-helix transcriptional regulator [Bacillota bacterium]
MADKIYQELGVRIARLRMKQGLSQSQIAGMLHIAQTTYSNYENGTHKIPLEQLQVLAAFYKVSYDELLGEPSESDIFDERTMIDKMSNLNICGKIKVLEYIDDISANEKYTWSL